MTFTDTHTEEISFRQQFDYINQSYVCKHTPFPT